MRRFFSWAATAAVLAILPTSLQAQEMGESLRPEPQTQAVAAKADSSEPLVQVALLLDTSGSMKGLVDQARCQLWNLVSDLNSAKRGGKPIRLEIAVYQYGTDLVSKKQGCLRQIVPFTEDLDQVSAGLFSLAVRGGDEYCGEVIGAALDQLSWSENPSVYKAVFIAGNESFDQGKRTFGGLLPEVSARSIAVNAIYCGTKYKDDGQWAEAVDLAGGAFAKIDHNHHLPDMKTPFDGKMRELNRKMNETFVWYGPGAEKAASNQRAQDQNAQQMSDHAFAARMSTKIGHLYHHVHHDLVDATRHGKANVAKMPESLMPESLKAMSPEERMEFIKTKIAERQSVRRQMAEVISQRHQYLEAKMSETLGDKDRGPLVLGDALVKMIRAQVRAKGYTFSEGVKLAESR